MIIAPISRMLPEIRNQQEKKQLELVQRNAMKLNSLIHQGLDLNRVDSGNRTLLILSQIELVSFARDLLALYTEGKMKEKQLACEFRTNREQLYIQMDAIKLESVLDNLLSNAVKYTPEGAQIRIHTGKKDGMVVVSVSDTGPGIPDEQKSKVFDMFYTGTNRAADGRRSLGLGLGLCRSIIRAHGGEIWVSDNKPQGAVFTFTLPAEEVTLHE